MFDGSQPLPDRLRGTFRETLGGLTKSNLTNTGSVVLRRVSTVGVLDSAP